MMSSCWTQPQYSENCFIFKERVTLGALHRRPARLPLECKNVCQIIVDLAKKWLAGPCPVPLAGEWQVTMAVPSKMVQKPKTHNFREMIPCHPCLPLHRSTQNPDSVFSIWRGKGGLQSFLVGFSMELVWTCATDNGVPMSTLLLENSLAGHICILLFLLVTRSPSDPSYGSNLSLQEPMVVARDPLPQPLLKAGSLHGL